MDTNDPLPAADLESRKLELEEEKVSNEREKIRIERVRSWTGNGSIFGSVLVVAGTVCLGIWSQYNQGQLQHQLAERQAKAQFELKAAEIVMSTNDPGVTQNKAKALQALFPQYLSENFASSFVPDDFARPTEIAATPAVQPSTSVRAPSPTFIRHADQALNTYGGDRPRLYKTRPSYPVRPVAPDDLEPGEDTMERTPETRNLEANQNPVIVTNPRIEGSSGNTNTNIRPVRRDQ